MKRVSFLGHFAFGIDKANGQTIKTKILGDEMKRQIGKDQVDFYDTMGGWLFVLKMPFILFRMLKNYKNVVVHPAYKGVRVIIPCLVLMNVFFHRKLHYIVLGGWLPSFVGKYPLLRWSLRRFDGMYSETHLIQDELKRRALDGGAIENDLNRITDERFEEKEARVKEKAIETIKRVSGEDR